LRRQAGRLRQWLWTGAATAAAVIALDAVQIGSKLTDARQRVNALTLASAEAVGMQDTHMKLLAAGAALYELEQTVAAEAGAGINMRAILQELSRVTPASIKLNSLRLSREGAEVMVRLHGRAIEIDTATGQTEVGMFIKTLKGSPLLRDASLRDVERGSFAQGNGERFEASFRIVLAPDISAIQVASGDEGELP